MKKEGLKEIYNAFQSFHEKYGDDWEKIHKEALNWYKQFPESSPIYASKHYTWMDANGIYFPSDISGPNYGQYRYEVIHPVTGKSTKQPSSGWRFPKETMEKKIAEGKIHFGKDETTVPNNKTYLKDTETQSLTSILYKDGRVATNNLNSLMGDNYFTNPKDADVLVKLINAVGLNSDDIVLDFFSGSGTMAEAVMNYRLNGIKLKYILVQLREDFDVTKEKVDAKARKVIERCIHFLDDLSKPHYLSEIGKERICRAGEKIKLENPNTNIDVGFKVFRVSDTNIKWNSSISIGQLDLNQIESNPDFVDFMQNAKDVDIVYELMLRQKK